MDTQQIFLTQFLMSLLSLGLVARWYVAPRLAGLTTRRALSVLMLPHMFRYIGLAFLVPQLVGPSLRGEFAGAAAYGDFASSLLAMVTLVALRAEWRVALPLAVLTNLVGTIDLANALRQVDVVPQLGVVWFIPTFVVPVLLVSHFMAFLWLFAHYFGPHSAAAVSDSAVCQAGV